MVPRSNRFHALAWRKSSASQDGDECVEVARTDNCVLVRDSQDRDGAILVFTHMHWKAFVTGVNSGHFDRA